MSRVMAVSYGCVVYLFFLAIFLYAIGFVENLPVPGMKTIDSGAAETVAAAFAIDILLLALFAVQHSVMARRGFKRWWTRIVPPTLERSTYVLAASLALALLIWQWRAIPATIWSVDNEAARVTLIGLSWLGWVMVLVATFLIDHFELFGLKQVVDHWHGRLPQPPTFTTPALYKIVRHPIYLGFLFAFWATPHMTAGHLLFAVATTGYIFVGILLEERDLMAHFGEDYRRYRERVPMIFPFPIRRGGRTPRTRRSPA